MTKTKAVYSILVLIAGLLLSFKATGTREQGIESVENLTKEWLEKHNITYDKLLMNSEDKLKIVTRNIKDYRNSTIVVVTPTEFMSRV